MTKINTDKKKIHKNAKLRVRVFPYFQLVCLLLITSYLHFFVPSSFYIVIICCILFMPFIPCFMACLLLALSLLFADTISLFVAYLPNMTCSSLIISSLLLIPCIPLFFFLAIKIFKYINHKVNEKTDHFSNGNIYGNNRRFPTSNDYRKLRR